MKVYCMVTEQGLVPMYDSDLDEKKKLKVGTRVLCDIKQPRNYEFHKKFFALLRLVVDNLPDETQLRCGIYNENDMLMALKLDFGMASVIRINGHSVYHSEESISFANMDESEFEKFYNRCVNAIINKYLWGTKKEGLIENIQQYF